MTDQIAKGVRNHGAELAKHPTMLTYSSDQDGEGIIIIRDVSKNISITMSADIMLQFINRMVKTSSVDVTLQEVS